MERITKAEFDSIYNDYKGVWMDYWADHPELLGGLNHVYKK